jgi:DNA-binding transcriptional MerR regulator
LPKQIENLIRMKKLCELTGVTRATVIYYISKGLIPKPIKSGRNMALYDQTHVKAIRIVKELQTKRYFPLAVIQDILAKKEADLTIEEKQMMVEVDGKFFLDQERDQKGAPLTARGLHTRTGVSLKEIRELERDGIIHSFKEGNNHCFDSDNIRLVECWAEIRALGFTKELNFTTNNTMGLYKDIVDRLTDEEARIMARNMQGKLQPQQIIKMVEQVIKPLTTIIEILHKRSIIETAARYAKQFRENS